MEKRVVGTSNETPSVMDDINFHKLLSDGRSLVRKEMENLQTICQKANLPPSPLTSYEINSFGGVSNEQEQAVMKPGHIGLIVQKKIDNLKEFCQDVGLYPESGSTTNENKDGRSVHQKIADLQQLLKEVDIDKLFKMEEDESKEDVDCHSAHGTPPNVEEKKEKSRSKNSNEKKEKSLKCSSSMNSRVLDVRGLSSGGISEDSSISTIYESNSEQSVISPILLENEEIDNQLTSFESLYESSTHTIIPLGNNYIRETLLSIVESHLDIWRNKRMCYDEEKWKLISKELFETKVTDDVYKSSVLITSFKNAVKMMRKKRNNLQKEDLSDSEIEMALRKWKLYQHVKFMLKSDCTDFDE